MAGEYRMDSVLGKLPVNLSRALRTGGLRIALTNQPMTNVTIRKDLSIQMADEYEKIGELKYANGLRSGSMVPIFPKDNIDQTYAPGELFFTT